MIPFYVPTVNAGMIERVTECLQSGWLNSGPWVQRWETALQQFCGADAVIATSSNTVGLEIALRWYGILPGDEVIVPAYSYCASALVVLNLGAKPVFWDCGVDLLPDIGLLHGLITSKTKAIIAVDLGGIPADYPEIRKIITAHKQAFIAENERQEKIGSPLLIADAAHSFGAFRGGIASGCLADISVFSFHSAKNITTGEGGAVCLKLPDAFSAEEESAWFHQIIVHGKTRVALHTTAAGNFDYDIEETGIKGNITDFQAAMGLAQLERYSSEILPARTAIAQKYSEVFSSHSCAGIPGTEREHIQSAWHIYPLVVRWISEQKRNTFLRTASEKGIGMSVHYKPVPAFTLFRNLGYDPYDCPVSLRMYASEITLPLYESLLPQHQEVVIDTLLGLFSEWD